MLSLRIALRYLLSRKSHGAVNVISAVSMAGVAVAAAAMIIVLSVFNGFSQLVERKTSNFNPPLMVRMADGKIIADADSLAAILARHQGIAVAAPMIDEQAFAISDHGQMPVTIRGMDSAAIEASGIADILIDGILAPSQATISVGVAVNLNLRPMAGERAALEGPVTDRVMIFEPNRTAARINPANPAGAFRGDTLTVTGVYQVEQEEQDRDLLVIPLAVARDLLDYTCEATAVAIYPSAGADIRKIKDELALPGEMVALDRIEQEAEAYRMIAVEKWITFLMLLFILAVASFNIISTLSLMVVEKEKNMSVMSAMGASPRLIKGIFANQGWLITLSGGLVGLLIGSLLTLGQQHFGWIKLNSANPAMMAIDHYPVSLHTADLLVVIAAIFLTSLLISLAGAWLSRTARRRS